VPAHFANRFPLIAWLAASDQPRVAAAIASADPGQPAAPADAGADDPPPVIDPGSRAEILLSDARFA